MSAIDQYGYQCMGIVRCPSSFPIMGFNTTARNVVIYRLDEDVPPDEYEFRGKKGDILLGGGSGEAAAFWIAIPEAFYFWTAEEWDEVKHWTDLCQTFWSATETYIFGEGYSKLGWSPDKPIELWLTHHILRFLVQNYPNEYQQYLGTTPLEEDGSICRMPDGYELWINRPPKYGRLPIANPQPRILFCEDPLGRHSPDPLYEAEVAAAKKFKLDFDLINYEALISGDAAGAIRKVAVQGAATLAVYRGWMLKPAQYNALWYALALRNIYLINEERAYKGCYYLPESYHAIEAHTPRSVWTEATSINAIMPLTREFRIFWLDGVPVYTTEYWEEGDYQNVKPPLDDFYDVARTIHGNAYPGVGTRFFTMDIAQKRDGNWVIVELGDAQVAGLPNKTDVPQFYRKLSDMLRLTLH